MEKKLHKSVFILDAKRTALARANRGMKELDIAQMSGCVIKQIVEASGIQAQGLDEVIMGNAVSAGSGQNFARKAVLLAGCPEDLPAYSVHNVCGSGLQAFILGVRTLLSGHARCVIAGAAESATHCPGLVFSQFPEEQVEGLIHDGLMCSLAEKHMGEICELIAQEQGVSRVDQDRFSLLSHQKAVHAIQSGAFREEIVPVPLPSGKIFQQDERPRKDASLEKFSGLPSAFGFSGSLTAGNVSVPGDGACGVLLGSEDFLKAERKEALARVLGYSLVATNGANVFYEGIEAIPKCLAACGLKPEQVDLFEITESFAAQALLTQKILKIPPEKMNVCGGDVALGHPLGMAGSRALVTLTHSLVRLKKKIGIAYIAFGSGGAIAVAVKAG